MDPAAPRERVYDVFADPGEDVDEKIARALDVGRQFLELPIGFVTRIEGGVQEIVHAAGDHPLLRPGEACPLDEAYCRRTVELDSALAVRDAAASSEIVDDAVRRFDLGTYIGAKVVVDGETYGTVCFAAERRRDKEFTDGESYFVELLARLVGQAFERRAYERELAEREAKLDERREIYRSLIDASFDLVFRIGTDGRFSYVSPPVEDLLGYPPDEYVGRPFTSMLPDEGTIELAGELFEQVVSGRTVEEWDFPLAHASGDRVWVDVRVAPIYGSDAPSDGRTPADITAVQGMVRDATGRHRRQRMIEVLNRVLRHNLRNDVTVISGFAGVLRDQLSGEAVTLADRIVETAERLGSLSETARTLEENLETAPALEPTDVVPVVRRVATRVDERHPEASVAVATPERAVAESAPRLETALWELADNAARHAGDRPSIELAVTVEDATVTVRVTDDGPGLPEQERAVLVAGRETPLVHGSGLGLWLVYWIVESLGGELEVRDDAASTRIELRLRRPSAGRRGGSSPDG